MPRHRPETIPAGQFKAKCLEILDRVKEAGAEFVVTKHGQPYAKLTRADNVPADPFGFLVDTVVKEGDLVSPDHASWRASNSDPLGG